MISLEEVWRPSGLVRGSGDMILRMLTRQERDGDHLLNVLTARIHLWNN